MSHGNRAVEYPGRQLFSRLENGRNDLSTIRSARLQQECTFACQQSVKQFKKRYNFDLNNMTSVDTVEKENANEQYRYELDLVANSIISLPTSPFTRRRCQWNWEEINPKTATYLPNFYLSRRYYSDSYLVKSCNTASTDANLLSQSGTIQASSSPTKIKHGSILSDDPQQQQQQKWPDSSFSIVQNGQYFEAGKAHLRTSRLFELWKPRIRRISCTDRILDHKLSTPECASSDRHWSMDRCPSTRGKNTPCVPFNTPVKGEQVSIQGPNSPGQPCLSDVISTTLDAGSEQSEEQGFRINFSRPAEYGKCYRQRTILELLCSTKPLVLRAVESQQQKSPHCELK